MKFFHTLIVLFLAAIHATATVIVWATEGFLSVQAPKIGPLMIDMGCFNVVSFALTGASLGRGPSFSLPMEVGEVRVLKY